MDAKQAADDDLTDLADGTLSASKVENNEYFITSAGTNGQVWTSDGGSAGGSGLYTEDLTSSSGSSYASGKIDTLLLTGLGTISDPKQAAS